MEVYTLDALLRRETLTDRFISLIWTERFSSYGDFELVLPATPSNIALFKPDVLLACNLSQRIMQVTTVQTKTDSDGTELYTVKGISLESVLADRVAFGVAGDLTTTPKWTLTGPPADLARKIFHDICVTGTLDPLDKLPFVVEGSILPNSTIDEPPDPVTIELEPTTVYDAIKSICDAYSLGFRFIRDADTSKIYFDVYTGSDHTSQQTDLAQVIFAPELESLQNTNELTSSDGFKNVAYVYSPLGYRTVYPLNVDPEVEGFERRVLVIKADDISDETLTPEEVQTLLLYKGRAELATLQKFSALDGEINQNSQYIYGVHYMLGDLIEIRGADGSINQMRVTEQIFVSDSEGERAYPTLSANLFIDSGTWLAWASQQVWSDLGETEYWENA